MSTVEYDDLFNGCQDRGEYHVFTFDIMNSKSLPNEERKLLQEKLIKLMMRMYSEIQDIENKTKSKILVFEDDFVSFVSKERPEGFGLKQEPFILGDAFGFTVYRDSIDKDLVYSLFEDGKRLENIDNEFHVSDGYYETNDYGEGNLKYFRGYCIDKLMNLHKEKARQK